MTDDLSNGPINFERIKAATRILRRSAKNLCALAFGNDPFVVGTPGRRKRAQWIADLWPQLGLPAGVHDRRVHYRLISMAEPMRRHNGQPYENTQACWKGLHAAIRDARFLGLLGPNTIIDRRSPKPMIHFEPMFDRRAAIESKSGWAYCLDPDAHLTAVSIGAGKIDVQLPEVPDLAVRATLYDPIIDLPRLALAHPPAIAERYMLEIWVEKSTLNDVVVPLGRELDVNIVTGTGDMSATQCEQFVERARRSGKPVRVLYVSDFDPQGENMPCGVARKIEFALRNLPEEKLDVQVRAVALTHAQCVEFQLPRTPMNDRKRAAKWSARYGEGQTEVDALEAVAPGALERILRAEVERYRDETIDRRIEDATAVFIRRLEAVNVEVRAQHADDIAAVETVINAGRAEIEQMRGELAAVVEPMREELTDLKDRVRNEMTVLADRMRQELTQTIDQLREEAERTTAPMREALERLFVTFRKRMRPIDHNLRDLAQPLIDKMKAELNEAAPTYDWPQPIADEDEAALYDSKRPYLEQLDHYHRHQGKKLLKLFERRTYPRVCIVCGKTFASIKPEAEVCQNVTCWRKNRQRKAMLKG
jgi:hypothetical protein